MAARYPIWHMAGINDIYNNEYSYLKGEGNIVRMYNARTKQGLAKQIFHCFMKKALEDIVENNDVLEMPFYKGAILIEEIPPAVLKKRKSEGKLEHFSEIFAMGKGYDMIYRFKRQGRYLKWRVIMGSSLFERFISLVNTGKRYFGIVKIW